MTQKRILGIGMAGYVGSWTVPQLLADGHFIRNFDIQYFGDGYLPRDNGNLENIKGDIRDIEAVRAALVGMDTVLMLGCISNDHSCQLDGALSRSVNYYAFEPLVKAAKAAGVKRFIYASSSSVYGISDAPEVREDHQLIPATLYNKSKMFCEEVLWDYADNDFVCTVIRPATVCGYAPRMRFDLTVNAMTHDAIRKGVITVYGGQQKRPNLHIKDMARCYRALVDAPDDLIRGQTFNVGTANMKVADIAVLIADTLAELGMKRPAVHATTNTDNRSYSVNSDKIAEVLGFRPQYTVADAIRDIYLKFQAGMWADSLENPGAYSNVLQMVKKHGFGAKQ